MSNRLSARERADFGDGLVEPEGLLFVASYASAGALRWLWQAPYDGLGGAEPRDLAAGSECVVVGGEFTGTVDFGRAPRTARGLLDGFLVCLDPTTGATAWDHQFGGTATTRVWAVATDRLGNVYAAGAFMGEVAVADETYAAGPDGDWDTFVVAVRPTGELIWSRTYEARRPMDMTETSEGRITLAVQADSSFDPGGGLVEPEMGGVDPVAVSFGPDGDFRWQATFSGRGDATVWSLTATEDSVLVSGEFLHELTLGPYTLENRGEALGPDGGFLAVLGPGGDVESLEQLQWPARGAGAGADGGRFLAGKFHDEVTFGHCTAVERTRPEHGRELRYDGYVVSLAADGRCEWLLHLASSSFLPPRFHLEEDYVSDLQLDPEGSPVFVGIFNGSLAIAGTELVAEVDTVPVIYVAKLEAD